MRYPSGLLQEADSILSDRRLETGLALDRRKEEIREQHPEIWQMHHKAMQSGAQMGMVLVMGDRERCNSLHKQMEECRSRLREMLVAAGLPGNYLDLWPRCSSCNDQGYISGVMCECRRQLLNRLAYRMLSNTSKIEECTFDTFRLDYYQGEDSRRMEKLLISCRRYAEDFSGSSPDLLFLGPPGLGKTHLSLAIAGEVVHKGKLVLYASAPQLLERLVDISFGRESQGEYKEIAYGCDLLVVDDLGTEFQTRFAKSEVYSLINTRHIEGRPTIINTNLTMQQLEAAYEERVRSRLENDYVPNYFAGTDIRYQKRINTVQRRKSRGQEEICPDGT